MDLPATDLALDKPALQSSTSRWSSPNAAEADAAIATNGDIDSPICFHTDLEFQPWWQVDLLEAFLIEKLLIYNRSEFPKRLKRFLVTVSLSGARESWELIYRKDDDAILGKDANVPFVIEPKTPCLGRFVRVQLLELGVLHFRECMIFGRRPTPEKEASLRRQMLDRLQRSGAQEEQKKAELFVGREGYLAQIGNHKIFVDTRNYSNPIIQSLSNATYEGRERQVIPATLRMDDRVVEIGTAIGVVTMLIASIVGAKNVVTYDANPSMVADARANFKFNHLEGITASLGVLRNKRQWKVTETEIDFFVSRDFWASRLTVANEGNDIDRVVRVPLLCLEEKIADHRANVLVCDIEGGEADLLLDADLSLLRLIIVETHYWASSRKRIDPMIRSLVERGFDINLDHTGGHIVVLDRNGSSGLSY